MLLSHLAILMFEEMSVPFLQCDKVLEGHEDFNIAPRLLPFPTTFRNAQAQAFISTSESYC